MDVAGIGDGVSVAIVVVEVAVKVGVLNLEVGVGEVIVTGMLLGIVGDAIGVLVIVRVGTLVRVGEGVMDGPGSGKSLPVENLM